MLLEHEKQALVRFLRTRGEPWLTLATALVGLALVWLAFGAPAEVKAAVLAYLALP